MDLAREPEFDLGGLQVKPAELAVVRNGDQRQLQPRVMQLLIALAKAEPSVISRDSLVEQCWNGRVVGDDALNRCILALRHVADSFSPEPFQIETIPRVGYRLRQRETAARPALARASEGAADPVAATSRAGAADSADQGHRRANRWAKSIVALLLLILAVGVWRWQNAAARTLPTVAVAGFVPLDGDSADRVYAATISAAVADALGKTGATLRTADSPIRTGEQARESGAALLIRGVIRHQGPGIRVFASVDSARTGAVIFTRSFDLSAADPNGAADRVAAELASDIQTWIAIFGAEPDPAVAEEFLRISTLWESGQLQPLELSRRLAAARPDSALAQALLAGSTAYALPEIPVDERAWAVASAREAAKRSFLLRPSFGETHYFEECMLRPPGRFIMTPNCDRKLREGMAVDPNSPYLVNHFAQYLAESGRFHEAQTLTDRALAQFPYDPGRLGWRWFTLKMENPADPGNELPGIEARAQRYWNEGALSGFRYDAAIASGELTEAERMLATTGSTLANADGKTIANTVFKAVKSRRNSDVTVARDRCIPAASDGIPADPVFATCLVGLTQLGDMDSVFRLAERGYPDVQCCSKAELEKRWLQSGGEHHPRFELFGKAMAPIRADRRFVEIARRTGLLAYWKSGHPPDFCLFEPVPVCALLRAGSS
jgi:DNA-binding winged helix-turn-helix (wHTH) protein/TolB-like protein